MLKAGRLERLGRIQIVDLEIAATFYGEAFLPHPFRWAKQGQFSTLNEHRDYARSVPDRLSHGDLGLLQTWFDTYRRSDIRVECNVNAIDPEGSGAQVLAHRLGDSGYLATQVPGENEIDIFGVSPYELADAVVSRIKLTRPGRHAEISVPGMVERLPEEAPDRSHSIRENLELEPVRIVSVSVDEIAAFSLIQSNWRPARFWGFDPEKSLVAWGTRKGDGDYISVPSLSGEAKPMARSDLIGRINRLIAEDIVALREARGQ
ncbi:ESX secretion-associated protein EspG [Mycobacteroides abscessus]|uniref:ESX secretion-associated protein EspG n=1 Tax=Mycobacteroides abscessus TaxID=36809 RepID=UPI0005DD7CFB|nr:ESX secretion-associated protein EspG [Mycobacteroides abscessus]CPW81463.1 Uncharacterised protein [Mycobacteroides abscessus]SKE35915.1 Uncharacterised protein [Mycobacteroides abscessus subsp. bolletii]SKG48158.1 Uncharacterised protein [Mycobacteroides abscessus subsp. bolletii]